MKVRITPDISFSRLRNSVGKEFEVEKLSDGGCRVEYELEERLFFSSVNLRK